MQQRLVGVYIYTYIYETLCVCVCVCVCVYTQLCLTVWDTMDCQITLSMEFSRREYWSRLQFPSPGDLPNPGIEPMSLILADGFFTTAPPWKS